MTTKGRRAYRLLGDLCLVGLFFMFGPLPLLRGKQGDAFYWSVTAATALVALVPIWRLVQWRKVDKAVRHDT